MSYFIHSWILKHYLKWVPSFGNLRINGYLLLPAAYRSLSRPSSAPSAKASALCSSSLDQKCCLMALIRSSFSTIRYLTLSESFFFSLVFSVNHWNCNRYPNHFLEKLLVFYLDFVFVVNLLIHKIYIQFSRYLYISVLVVDLGGLEPPASRLSGVRSNLLSYRSIKLIVQDSNLP